MNSDIGSDLLQTGQRRVVQAIAGMLYCSEAATQKATVEPGRNPAV
jgi:hypothetical protein